MFIPVRKETPEKLINGSRNFCTSQKARPDNRPVKVSLYKFLFLKKYTSHFDLIP
jgi:hypothetical protein